MPEYDYLAPNSYTDLGYQAVYRNFDWSPPLPDSVPDSSDPRGNFKSGSIPSKVFSYRILLDSLAFGQATVSPLDSFASSPLGFGAIANIAQNDLTLDFVNCRFKNKVCLVVCEGKDIIDYPTDDLPLVDGVMTLPFNVLRLIHAGEQKLVPENDNRGVGYWASLAVHGQLEGNLARGVKLNDPTDDRKSVIPEGTLLMNSDTGSNKIIVSGSPKYVSLVANVKPIFRDVITIRGNALAFGFSNPMSGFEITTVGPSTLELESVNRFSFVNKEEDSKQPPRMGWRISESFGISNAQKPISIPEKQIKLLNSEQKKAYSFADTIKWYAYDLGKENSEAYNAELALLMTDSTSPFYKKGFQSVVLSQQADQIGYGKGILDWYSVLAPAFGTSVTTQVFYTSPIFNLDLSNNTKIAHEYFTSLEGNLETVTILTKTTQTATGMSILYDPATSLSMLVESSTNGVLEKMYDDSAWVNGGVLPESEKAKFQLGEYPFRSQGQAILIPEPNKLADDDSESLATRYTFVLNQPQNDTFKIMNESEEVLLEVSTGVWPIKQKEVILGIPPLKGIPKTKEGGGIAKIKSRWGSKEGDVILEAQTGGSSSLDPSEFQIANIKELKFPMKVQTISNTMDPISGIQFLAYGFENRVDMAVRTTYKDPFSIIRDVTLRLNQTGDTNPSNLPTSGDPCLVMDSDSRTLFLFYVYQATILVKKIPFELFVSDLAKNYYQMYSTDTEMSLIKKLQAICPNLVAAETYSKISRDLRTGKIKIQQELLKRPSGSDISLQIGTYSVFLDKAGILYIFVQSNGRIIVKSSSDLGAVWDDKVTEKFSFFPVEEDEEVEISSPYTLYDQALDVTYLFFIYKESLFCLPLDMPTLRNKDSDVVEEKLEKYIKPNFVFGTYTQNMSDKKIKMSLRLGDNEKPTGSISPQKITGMISKQGYYRIFFKDSESYLRSFISNDHGNSWYEDNKFSRKVVES